MPDNDTENFLYSPPIFRRYSLCRIDQCVLITAIMSLVRFNANFVPHVSVTEVGTNSPRWSNNSSFYTHATGTSIKFIKEKVKMHSVGCQLLKKKFRVPIFHVSIIYPIHIGVGFTIFQWDSLITMRNDLHFWKNIFQVKYAVFRDAVHIFYIFLNTVCLSEQHFY